MLKLRLALTLVAFGLVASIGVGSAQAQLDPFYGQNGIASVTFGGVTAMDAAADGTGYVLTGNAGCGAIECTFSHDLFRYTPDGTLDPSFGGSSGSYGLSSDHQTRVTLAVDHNGLPLLEETSREGVVVRRLTEGGILDPTFGAGGVVRLKCDCLYSPTQIVPTTAGGLLTIISGSDSLAAMRVVRLAADGSPDPRFGKKGTATFKLPHAQPFTAASMSQQDALYIAGEVCCHFSHPLYLARISARGRLDTRFLSTARRSLNSIGRFSRLGTTIEAVLPRPGGKIDLLGYAGRRQGFLVRLNPNGRLHRQFGRRGTETLPYPVVSAAMGDDGAELAATDANMPGGGRVLRILAGGRIDPAFVPRLIPNSEGDTGLSIVHLFGGRSLLLDLGLHRCRSICPYRPKLIRYLEPAPQR